MDLILLVLVLSVVAFIVYLITTKIPMDPMIKTGIQVIAFVVLLLYLLRRLGIIPNVM